MYILLVSQRLTRAVTTVDNDIGTSGVGASIANQVHIGSLQLLGLTVTAHGDHALPQILGILIDEIRKAGINIARGYAVNTSKIPPLVGEGASHMDAASLGDIVRCLLLREVGNVAGHGGGDDKASSAALFEVVADGLGTVEGASEIGLDNLVPVFDGAIKDTAIGCAAGVGNESIDLEASRSASRRSSVRSLEVPCQSP